MRGSENDNVEEKTKIGKRRLEMRIGRKWRTWSRRVVQDTSEMRIDGMEDSCWSKLPPELLREVLVTLERSESDWPMRRNVVACAGVCTTWRDVIKDIAKSPEFNGKITFPISVKEPGPRDNVIKCFIKRDRSTQMYLLYLNLTNALAEDGKFLLTAQRCRRATCNDYIISINKDDMTRGGGCYLGKLRSNFLGTKFTIYDSQPPHGGTKMTKSCSTRLAHPRQFSSKTSVGNHAVAHISYELNALVGSRAPRRMVCSMDTIPTSATEPGGIASTQKEFPRTSFESFLSFPFFRSKSNRINDNLSGPQTGQEDGTLVLRNKAPRWHEQLHCWCLNFHGRVTVASVKNFQLVACPHNGVLGNQHEKVILQFGKVGKDLFTMDYRYPISAFQAFAICLSSFDTKIACE